MTPYVSDPDFTLHVGDVREVLRELEPESVDCAMTSPPFYGLRDYGTGTWEGGTVLDPFMGSGTTAHVARRLGRNAIGVELNPEYAAMAARRLAQLSLLA